MALVYFLQCIIFFLINSSVSRRDEICKYENVLTDCFRALSIYKAMGKNSISAADLSKSLLEPESCCTEAGFKCEGDAVVDGHGPEA